MTTTWRIALLVAVVGAIGGDHAVAASDGGEAARDAGSPASNDTDWLGEDVLSTPPASTKSDAGQPSEPTAAVETAAEKRQRILAEKRVAEEAKRRIAEEKRQAAEKQRQESRQARDEAAALRKQLATCVGPVLKKAFRNACLGYGANVDYEAARIPRDHSQVCARASRHVNWERARHAVMPGLGDMCMIDPVAIGHLLESDSVLTDCGPI